MDDPDQSNKPKFARGPYFATADKACTGHMADAVVLFVLNGDQGTCAQFTTHPALSPESVELALEACCRFLEAVSGKMRDDIVQLARQRQERQN